MGSQEKLKILLLINENDQKHNFDFIDKNLELISGLFQEINEKLALEKTKLKKHEDLYEVHNFKFVLQTLSIKLLFTRTPIKFGIPNLKFHDLSTIYNSCRSLVELFLVLNYLYYDFKTEDQATFRYLLYVASGLNSRQSYHVYNEEDKRKKELEKVETQKLISEIKKNEYFKSLHSNKQNDITGRLQAFEIGKEQMIIESKLDSKLFHTVWKLFSNYSHSEYIEAMQLREYLKNIEGRRSALYTAYRLCLMLNCAQVIKTTERFPEAKAIFDKQNFEIKTIIELYNKLTYGIKLSS